MGAVVLRGQLHDLPGIEVRQDPLTPSSSFFSARTGTHYRGIVLHHDACLSAAACLKLMRARRPPNRVSTHFVIDNDGSIVQLADPLLWRAWSACEHDSGRIAIDLSNACDLIYATRYTPRRPVLEQVIHGAKVLWLAPYPVQVDSLAALVRLLCRVVGIPAAVPLRADGSADLRLLSPVPDGVIGHLHCQTNKQGKANKADPFGLDWPELQRRIHA